MFRQVQPEEGKILAEEWNCAWTEASARHNENVAKAFELVIGEVEKQFAPPPEEKGKCIISVKSYIYIYTYILVQYPSKICRGLEAQRLIFVPIKYYRDYYFLRTSRPAIHRYNTFQHRKQSISLKKQKNMSRLREIPSQYALPKHSSYSPLSHQLVTRYRFL